MRLKRVLSCSDYDAAKSGQGLKVAWKNEDRTNPVDWSREARKARELEGTMPSELSARRSDAERQKNISKLRRRLGTTDRASLNRPHISTKPFPRHGSLQLPGHGVCGKSDAALWVDVRKERRF